MPNNPPNEGLVTVLPKRLLPWFDAHNRTELPWRRPETTPWGVLVSEVMSQQTPVSRVAPLWEAWMERWPSPADVADAAGPDILTMWGRLGYPRRAMRLRECAQAIAEKHGNEVPRDLDELRALPGIGVYTAAAVAVFAYGHRHPVVDTNVRRVVARLSGKPDSGTATSQADLDACEALLPEDQATAARLSIALMELGSLVCKAREADCASCPVVDVCGFAYQDIPEGPSRKRQKYTGTNRHVRGNIIELLRQKAPRPRSEIDLAWKDAAMVNEALAQLLHEGLVETDETGLFQLGA
ncbi:HhH-GPD family protein [Salininema proteolyticum]|uniref:Adenine DNA glycosylase n=1 Tax=Salininema proteolyticum TaxID=1607685 RepID=A0ABV8TU96_9ACTN